MLSQWSAARPSPLECDLAEGGNSQSRKEEGREERTKAHSWCSLPVDLVLPVGICHPVVSLEWHSGSVTGAEGWVGQAAGEAGWPADDRIPGHLHRAQLKPLQAVFSPTAPGLCGASSACLSGLQREVLAGLPRSSAQKDTCQGRLPSWLSP